MMTADNGNTLTDRRSSHALRLVLGATVASSVGTGMTVTAVPLLVLAVSETPSALGLVTAVSILPTFLFSVPAGMLADRRDRRGLMIRADLLRAGLVAVIAVLAALDVVSLLPLLALSFSIGVGDAFFTAASQAMLPNIVQRDEFDSAIGRLSVATDVGVEFVGPPLGALLFSLGRWVPFVGDATSYVVSAALLGRLAPATGRTADSPTAGAKDVGRRGQLRAGWHVLRRSRQLTALAITTLIGTACVWACVSLIVLVVRDRLHVSSSLYGLFFVVIALGGAVSGGSAGRVLRRYSAASVLAAALLVTAAAFATLALTREWAIGVVAMFAWGSATTMITIVAMSMQQKATPDAIRGTTMGISRMFLAAGSVLGAVSGGLLATSTSVSAVYMTAACGLLGLSFWWFLRGRSLDGSSA